MKRGREGGVIGEISTMANCLMLLTRGGGDSYSDGGDDETTLHRSSAPDAAVSHHRVFECKTCNRQFPSFQALGGHRASHKKPKITAAELSLQSQIMIPPKPKTHECSICGLEFSIGQALGGHMRRHRAAAANDINPDHQDHMKMMMPPLSLSPPHQPPPPPPLVKKSSNNSRRVLCLDLNLTPLENALEFPFNAKLAPPPPPLPLDCYF